MVTKFNKTFNYKSQIDPKLFHDAPKEFLKELEKYNQVTKFKNLVSKFETENPDVKIENAICGFGKFLTEEGVEPWNIQPMKDEYNLLLSRRITEKVNKTEEMSEEEVYFITDFLYRDIEINGDYYISEFVKDVGEINDETIDYVINESIDKMLNENIEEGNIPNCYTSYKLEHGVLEDYFITLIDEMKEEQDIE